MSAKSLFLTETPMGGLEGVRLAAALAFSIGVHAGVVAFLDLGRNSHAPAVPGPVSVRLVAAPTHELLEPLPPPQAMARQPIDDASVQSASAGSVALRPSPTAARVLTPVITAAQAPVQVASLAPQAALPGSIESARILRPSTVRARPEPRAHRAVASPAKKVRRVAPARKPEGPVTPEKPRTAISKPVETTAPAVDMTAASANLPSAASPAVTTATAPIPSRPARPLADNPRPRYPMIARKRGQQGRVTLRLRVSADGTPSSVQVIASSGVASLDEAARKAVARWRFAPAEHDGRPRAATLDVPVEFRLDGSG